MTFSLLVFCCFVAQLLSESSCSVNEDTKMLYEKLEFTFNKMVNFKLRTHNLLMHLPYMDKSDRKKLLLKERCNIFCFELIISCGVTVPDWACCS